MNSRLLGIVRKFLGIPVLCASSLFLCSAIAKAATLPLPASLAHEALSETVPTAFSPAGFEPVAFDVPDFALEWRGDPLPGVEARLGEKSFEWVRAIEVLAIPRARLLLRVRDAEGGRITHAGFSHPLVSDEGQENAWAAEIPVALISGERNPVEIRIRRAGKEIAGKLELRFKPRARAATPRVFLDPSCSRFDMRIEALAAEQGNDAQWVYVGCRLIVAEGDAHRTPTLESYVFWDNVGQSLELGGIETPASSPSLWALRLPAKAAPVRLKASGQGLVLRYSVPERLRLGSIGLGLGPYTYFFDGLGNTTDTVAPLLTVYGSFFLTESMRFVAFSAASISQNSSGDLGVYLNTENFRIFDRRLGIYLLLGGHVIGFQSNGSFYAIPGFPQGMELIYSDAFGKGRNLSLGGFLYPEISGKAYTNAWLRWGGRIFGEINYISWREKIGESPIYSRSVGLSFGMPIGRFY